jgi:hypothetical protein
MKRIFNTAQWLRDALKLSGMTHQQLSDAIGGMMSRDQITKAASIKKGQKPRGINAQELLAIATATGHRLPEDYENKTRDNDLRPLTVPVTGIISPGTWREAGISMKLDYAVSAVADPKMAKLPQYALRFEDLNYPMGRFRYGDFLIFVQIAPNAANIEDDDIVHVERFDKGKTETSINIVRILPDGRYSLTAYGRDDEPTVVQNLNALPDMAIKGVFVGSYSPKRP